jgi:hypothetical protein
VLIRTDKRGQQRDQNIWPWQEDILIHYVIYNEPTGVPGGSIRNRSNVFVTEILPVRAKLQ